MENNNNQDSFISKIKDIYSTLSKKKDLKNLTIFLILNLSFMFIEVIYGLISNSLGLLTDGAHMLLDCTAVLIGLLSAYLSDFKGNSYYTFGYGRSELIGTFINSVFLFFIAIYIVFESIERFLEPKEVEGENLILVSFLGLLVNLVGIYFFHDININEDHHHHHHHKEDSEKTKLVNNNKHNDSKHDHKNENLYAIYIHILADTLGSVAVLISAFLIKFFNMYISDPICSLSISVMILYSSTPVLKSSILTLLHYQNEHIISKKDKIKNAIFNINTGEGVSMTIGHFEIWSLKKGYDIAEIKIALQINSEDNNNTYDIIAELQNKISTICKENHLSEYYIDVS